MATARWCSLQWSSSAGGAIIEDVTGLAKYYQAILSESVSDNNIKNVSHICHGSAGMDNFKMLGRLLGAGPAAGIHCHLPLFHGVFSAEKMIPLDTNSPLEFQFYLNTTIDSHAFAWPSSCRPAAGNPSERDQC